MRGRPALRELRQRRAGVRCRALACSRGKHLWTRLLRRCAAHATFPTERTFTDRLQSRWWTGSTSPWSVRCGASLPRDSLIVPQSSWQMRPQIAPPQAARRICCRTVNQRHSQRRDGAHCVAGPAQIAVKAGGSTVACSSACRANVDGTPANSSNCCTGSFSSPSACPPSKTQFYDFFSAWRGAARVAPCELTACRGRMSCGLRISVRRWYVRMRVRHFC